MTMQGWEEQRGDLDIKPRPRRLWKCDQCGAVAPWADGWCVFASLLDEEFLHPDELATVCGDDCRAAFDARIKAGEVVVPHVKMTNARAGIIKREGKRRGY